MTERDPTWPPPGGMAHVFADRYAEGDEVAFEFDGLARTLAELALNPRNRTPFTVVVRGGWGRGKTTLLHRTQTMLEASGGALPAGSRHWLRRRWDRFRLWAQPNVGALSPADADAPRVVKTLWFNAWKCPEEDTVLAGLLGALLDRMRTDELLTQAARFIDAHKEWAAGLFLRKAFPFFFEDGLPESRYAGVEAKRAFFDTFEQLFGQLLYVRFHGWAALGDNFGSQIDARRETLAVFLDDLDRCRPDRVLEVLEAINLFLDTPGVCFYLGLDWERLLAVLAQAETKYPPKFLEKLIQVSFDLPDVTPEGAIEYLRKLLPQSPHAALFTENVTAAISRVLESRHPRHVKRFLNDLSIRLALLRNAGYLGEDDEHVSPEAVVTWHLLLEALETDLRRTEHTGNPGNLTKFLGRARAWREAKQQASRDAGRGEASADDVGVFDKLQDELPIFETVSGVGLHYLINFGSPPRREAKPPLAASVAAAEVREGPPPSPFESLLEEPISKSRAPTREAPSVPNDLGFQWVPVPGGTFRMGSNDEDAGEHERPVHTVHLSPFECAKYPVTNRQYAAFVTGSEARPPAHWANGAIPPGKEDHPVVNVTWEDATRFCRWVSEKPGRAVSLPTEAQWEFVARGSNGRKYPWGDEKPDKTRANFGMNVGDTTPVDTYPAGKTPEGVHDLAGNVWEWCADWYGEYSSDEVTDPTGPPEGQSRVVRGGSFDNFNPWSLRAAFGLNLDPDYAYVNLGFRCVRVAPGGQTGLGS